MFVRLQELPKGPAGKWTDAATCEHGDLLDIIRESLGLRDFREVAEEARRFLNCLVLNRTGPEIRSSASTGWIAGGSKTPLCDIATDRRDCGRAYLQRRGISRRVPWWQPAVSSAVLLSGPDEELPAEIWPAMIACVTDLNGTITGVHRTWLDPDGFDSNRLGKAPIDTPRRAMGDLLGNAVRISVADDVLVAGEGIETMLSLRCVLPTMPMAAALSANHLAAMLLPLELASPLYRPRRRCRRRRGAGSS